MRQSMSLRKIKVLIPPSSDPMLTPYTNKLKQKIVPFKKQHSILSNLSVTDTNHQPTVKLNKEDFKKINKCFYYLQQRKPHKHQVHKRIHQIVKEKSSQQKNSNAEFLKMVEIRQQMVEKNKHYRYGRTNSGQYGQMEQQKSQQSYRLQNQPPHYRYNYLKKQIKRAQSAHFKTKIFLNT